jgi:hypothetical protein
MAKPIKKYLVFGGFCWLAAVIILLILNSIKTGTLPALETLLSILVVLLVVVPVLRMLFYLQTLSRKRTRGIVLDRSPFTDFLANGFVRRDNNVVGVIRGYTIVISYEGYPPPCIELKVLFDPAFLGGERTKAELEQICSTKESVWKQRTLYWLPYFMMCRMPIVFKRLPGYENVNERINFIIDAFQKGGLKPVGIEFYEMHYPKELLDE